MHTGRDYDPSDPGENEVYAIDFVNDLPTGSTIAGATVALTVQTGSDPSPSSHLIGGYFVVGTVVSQQISGLLAGNVYTLQIVITTSGGGSISLWAHIPCEAVY